MDQIVVPSADSGLSELNTNSNHHNLVKIVSVQHSSSSIKQLTLKAKSFEDLFRQSFRLQCKATFFFYSRFVKDKFLLVLVSVCGVTMGNVASVGEMCL